ncbi:MAG: hypothetical protein L0Y58_05710 [Verrucomicrobia subdivision 3 bacterium]|nr:hypothetical protein [Limisphaerales bacterium]
MPRVIINGSRQPILTQRKTDFDPSKGVTVTEEYESAGDNLNGLAVTLAQRRVQYNHTPNGRKSKLVCSFSGPQSGVGEIPVDTWQLLANEDSKDLRTLPAVHNLYLNNRALFEEIDLAIKRDLKEEEVDFQGDATALALFRHNKLGITSYLLSTYVLRHTTNVSNVYNSNVADFGVNLIYTTGQLLNEVTNGNFWLFPMPGRMRHKIENIPEWHPPDLETHWGWRKLASQETMAAGNRIDIATEYWLAAWSKFIYAVL